MRIKVKEFIKNNADMVFSFALPIVMLGLAYTVFYLFTKKTILICDMNSQYVNFYASVYDILKGGKSLLYSWTAGMGINYIGLFAYYLSSPFTFLILLFQKQHLPEALLFITILKFGLISLTFSAYSRYVFRASKRITVIFSVLYALMSYSIVYSFDLMWLDGVLFLPVILLGIEKILKENRFILFCTSLCLLFIANFYISYMVGIFSFLYFIVTYLSHYSIKQVKVFLHKILLFGLSALLAAGMAAFLVLPTYFALKSSQSDPTNPFLNVQLNFHLFDLFSKLLAGSYDTLRNDAPGLYFGLPNIYAGLLPLLLGPLFFMNKKIALKERLLYLFFMIFMVCSFDISSLNLIWHACDAPNWFPYRYSFLFSFLMIYMAHKSFVNLDYTKSKRVLVVYGGWMVILFCIYRSHYTYLAGWIIIANALLLTGYVFLFHLSSRLEDKRATVLLGILVLVCLEVLFNSGVLSYKLNGEFGYVDRKEYDQPMMQLKENLVRRIENSDQSFFRMETVDRRTVNDPMRLGYHGIAHYSSMANKALNRFLKQLGFSSPYENMTVYYTGATRITDSLLGIKYLISPENLQDRSTGYSEFLSDGGLTVYKNDDALPIGFLVNRNLSDMKPAENNPLQTQNDLINLATEKEGKQNPDRSCLIPLEIGSKELDNVTFSNAEGKQVYKKIENNQDGSVEFEVRVPGDCQVYTCFPPTDYSFAEAYLNNKPIGSYLHDSNFGILDLGYHQKGERLSFKLVLKKENISIYDHDAYFYGLDEASFKSAIYELENGALEDIHVTDTSVSGKVDVKENNLLFTSIPFDPGWEAWVDGRKADIRKIGEAFIGIQLEKGQHEVVLEFMPEGFRLGITISVGSSILLLSIICVCALSMKRTTLKL